MVATPSKVHAFVEKLCSKIRSGAVPVRIPVLPDSDAQVNQCFINVPKKITDYGGKAQHGWTIWELPGLFIEAEAHAVWVNPTTGQFIDVTPKPNRVSEILFLADDSVIFNENDLRRRDNIRMAIKDDPAVQAFLKSAAEYAKYLEDSTDPNDPRRMIIDREIEGKLVMRKMQLQLTMERLPIGRNDMCRCGSAEKYKRCCGR